MSTVLSNSYALAGLMMQASVYLIWFLVVPGYKKAFKYKEAAPDKYEDEEAEPLARVSEESAPYEEEKPPAYEEKKPAES